MINGVEITGITVEITAHGGGKDLLKGFPGPFESPLVRWKMIPRKPVVALRTLLVKANRGVRC